MASTTEKTTAALVGNLLPGEQVIAASKAQLEGGTMRIAKSVAFGPASGIFSTDGDDPSKHLANGAILAVTEKRVIVMSVTATAFSPKDAVLEIDRARISGVAVGEKKVMFIKLPTLTLDIEVNGENSSIAFEIPKAARKDFEAVTAALGA